jgi:hypothetical protein
MAHLAMHQQITYTWGLIGGDMAKPKTKEIDTRTQRQKFIDAAREHGADGDEDTFRKTLRKVATAPVSKAAKKPKK